MFAAFFTVSAITREENNQLWMLDLNFTLHCLFEKFMPWEVLFVTKIPSASWNVMIWAQHGRTDIFVLGNMSTYEEFFLKSDKIYSWKFVMLISALCLLKAGYEMYPDNLYDTWILQTILLMQTEGKTKTLTLTKVLPLNCS